MWVVSRAASVSKYFDAIQDILFFVVSQGFKVWFRVDDYSAFRGFGSWRYSALSFGHSSRDMRHGLVNDVVRTSSDLGLVVALRVYGLEV